MTEGAASPGADHGLQLARGGDACQHRSGVAVAAAGKPHGRVSDFVHPQRRGEGDLRGNDAPAVEEPGFEADGSGPHAPVGQSEGDQPAAVAGRGDQHPAALAEGDSAHHLPGRKAAELQSVRDHREGDFPVGIDAHRQRRSRRQRDRSGAGDFRIAEERVGLPGDEHEDPQDRGDDSDAAAGNETATEAVEKPGASPDPSPGSGRHRGQGSPRGVRSRFQSWPIPP